MGNSRGKYIIIYLSLERISQEYLWDSALVALPLAKITPVLFFEPPWEAILGIIKNFRKWRQKCRLEKSVIKKRDIPSNMRIVRLYSFLPWGWTNRWVSKINRLFVLLQIKWHIRKYPVEKRILLTYWRDSAELLKKISAHRCIHHCQDEIAGFPWPSEEARKRAKEKEAKVAKIVDLVLVTSPTLVEPMSVYNKNVKILANDVVDFEFFNKDLRMPPPEELESLRRPLIGYVGNLSRFKQDFDLIENISTRLPDWSFVIIGPCMVDVKDYSDLPHNNNIIYLGSRMHEEVPRYVAAFDVGIIPNKNNLYNQHSFPMKFFEYLALGKPVVATDMPALKPYEKYVYIAKNPDDFVNYLKLALKEDSPGKQKERIQFAAAHSWQDRGPKILDLLCDTSCATDLTCYPAAHTETH